MACVNMKNLEQSFHSNTVVELAAYTRLPIIAVNFVRDRHICCIFAMLAVDGFPVAEVTFQVTQDDWKCHRSIPFESHSFLTMFSGSPRKRLLRWREVGS